MDSRVSTPICKRTLLVLLVLFSLPGAEARTWTTITGEHFEADFVRIEGGNGVFKVKEKDYPYPMNQLSVPDRLFIGRTANQQSKEENPAASLASPSPSSLTTSQTSPEPSATPAAPSRSGDQIELAGQPLKPGHSVEIDIPITDPAALREVKEVYGKPSDKARMLVAVPENFAPAQKSYPLLMISATADGAASSIGTAHQYVKSALAKGFVVLAVDGELGKPPKNDPPPFRWALAAAGREALEKEWPDAKQWPVATAGVSGGGGYASYHALKLLQEHANLIGVLLAVSPHNPTKFTSKVSVPAAALHSVPIFMSAGDSDKTATKAVTDQSHRELTNAGFKKVRYEHFDGGHYLYQPHLEAALDWFLEESKGASPPSR